MDHADSFEYKKTMQLLKSKKLVLAKIAGLGTLGLEPNLKVNVFD